jgi:hypothetical protein
MSWAIPATVVSMTFLQRADGGRETVSFRAGGRAHRLLTQTRDPGQHPESRSTETRWTGYLPMYAGPGFYGLPPHR